MLLFAYKLSSTDTTNQSEDVDTKYDKLYVARTSFYVTRIRYYGIRSTLHSIGLFLQSNATLDAHIELYYRSVHIVR